MKIFLLILLITISGCANLKDCKYKTKIDIPEKMLEEPTAEITCPY